ncbi:MAG: phosphoribosylglycinamide formyltransferase [Alphaproteobacteria bacterium]|nr:phosphoribosylglycinamide formyltransferase [Alphaproteobacteria bacterium]
MTSSLKVGVLISGRGSNLQALIDACKTANFPARIVLVISNNPDAAGLGRAEAAGIATAVIDHRDYPDRRSFDDALDGSLRAAGVDTVCLAGFMRLLTAAFLDGWHNRVLNVHPSLLPAFKGMHAQRDAIEAGVKLAGCTVHVVRPEMDSGPIIAQAAVPVLAGDDENTLAARILEMEHVIYPLALRLIAEGRVTIAGTVADTAGAAPAPSALINPSGQ